MRLIAGIMGQRHGHDGKVGDEEEDEGNERTIREGNEERKRKRKKRGR